MTTARQAAPAATSLEHPEPASVAPSSQAAIVTAGEAQATRHSLDIRLSVPLVRKRFYIRLIAGPERRNADRLKREGQTSPVLVSLFWSFVLFTLVSFTLFGFGAALYILKSLLGINLFDGPSFLHDFFFMGRVL